jgi:two-component system nitrogen regulation sensor histidine kinase GlnL
MSSRGTDNVDRYYANVIDSVGDGVIVLDTEQLITLMNPAAEQITGISRTAAQGQPLTRLLRREVLLLEMVEKTARSGMSISDHENVVLQGSGHMTPVSVTTSPLLSDSGTAIGTIIVIRDLTKVRELEEAVRHADRLSSLGTLAAGLAHEIKNPLGGIKGAAQLLDRELTDQDELREYPRVMIREVERINHIVVELLNLAAPRGLNLSHVNLHQVLGDLLLLQRPMLDEKRVTIQQQLDPSIPPILLDEPLITQLLLNLLKNALEAVSHGGQIRVVTRIVSEYSLTKKGERPSRMVAIDIADDGPGIPPELQEKLFTPFFTTKEGGTGLGLPLCQKIVTEHRGMIKVDSQPGHGTTFTIMLPFIQ